jgi:hypothetical protein
MRYIVYVMYQFHTMRHLFLKIKMLCLSYIKDSPKGHIISQNSSANIGTKAEAG